MGDTVLIVDEVQAVRQTLAKALSNWGYAPVEIATAADAIISLDNERPDMVLLDIGLSSGASLGILREIKRRQPETVVIVITAQIHFDDVLAALRSGADDFISEPINLEELEVRVRNGREMHLPIKEIESGRRARTPKLSFDQIIGRSPSMQDMLRLARRVAESEVSSVLLQGASGTGKDLVAKAIHFASKRSSHPFVAINCAALPPNLIESELFGYEKGAFTDAKARKEGLLEQGNGGGTIFLDEISELDINLQAKLLRVLEEGSFRRVGGLKDVSFNARVIAASNRDLKRESEAGRFRLDLYYRLAVIQIDLPPLSERGDDVLLLAHHFINRIGHERIGGLTPEAARAFQLYGWPGNVRELRNAIERAMILEDGDAISTQHLSPDIVANVEDDESRQARASVVESDSTISLPTDGISLDEVETSLIKQALSRSGGNQTHAAELLGMTRDKFRYRLKKLKAGNPARRSVSAAAGASHY
jgi:two-component system response regulator AtoC